MGVQKFMPLLAIRNLIKLRLRNPGLEPLQARKNLRHTLGIHRINLRLSDKSLDLCQTRPDQVISQPILNFRKEQLSELLILAFPTIEDLVHESDLEEFFGGDTFTHYERFVGFAYPETLDEGS